MPAPSAVLTNRNAATPQLTPLGMSEAALLMYVSDMPVLLSSGVRSLDALVFVRLECVIFDAVAVSTGNYILCIFAVCLVDLWLFVSETCTIAG